MDFILDGCNIFNKMDMGAIDKYDIDCQIKHCKKRKKYSKDYYKLKIKMNKKIITKCKACGADIFFIETKNGKFMPLNAEIETADGNKLLWVDELTGFKKLPAGRKGYSSHFSNCPEAGKFRKN